MSIADSFMVQPFSVGEIIETLRDNHDSVRRIAYDLHQKPDVPKLQQEVECLSTALARNRRAYTQIETTLPSSVAKRMKTEFSNCAESLSKVSRELEELQNFPDFQRRAAKVVQESSLYSSMDDFEGVKEEIDTLINAHPDMPLSLLKELLMQRAYVEQRLEYFRKKVHPIMTKEKLQIILSGIRSIRVDQTDKAKVRADLEDLFNSPEGNSFKKIVYSTLGRQNGIIDEDQAQHYGREHLGDDIAAVERILNSAVDAFSFAAAI